MASKRYVALLRGINVGGKNTIPMSQLRASFEALGLAAVVTYIQSGNVIFQAEGQEIALLTRIGAALSSDFAYEGLVILRSTRQMQNVVDRAPDGFGTKPDTYRYDVAFLRPGLTPARALKDVRIKEGVDEATAGPGVFYFRRLIKRASSSYLSKLASTPVYRELSIRNWNTTTKLLGLLRQ